MNRSQPPCNTCAKHDCRSCAWTSPLDASYRTLIQSHSLLSIVALNVRTREDMPREPSWFATVARRVAEFFSHRAARAK